MGQNVILKADRPHQHDCLHTSSDYRHTDKHLRLVMSTLCPLLHSAKPSPYYRPLGTRNLTLTLTRPLTLTLLTLKQYNCDVITQFLAGDLDLWPTTLTYSPTLARVKVDPHAKNQGQRSNGSNRRGRILRHTMDGQTLPIPLSPCFANALRSIMTQLGPLGPQFTDSHL